MRAAAQCDSHLNPSIRDSLHETMSLCLQHTCITPELVRMAKRRQVTVWCWSPNREADWARLLDAGVDGIMTDHPAKLRAFIAARAHRSA